MQGKEEPQAHSHTEQWGLFLQHTRKPHTQFLWLEELVLLSGAKFLLLDGQWQLGLDVHDGPLHHHEAVLVQQIREEEGLWGREGAGDESVVLAPLCLSLPD